MRGKQPRGFIGRDLPARGKVEADYFRATLGSAKRIVDLTIVALLGHCGGSKGRAQGRPLLPKNGLKTRTDQDGRPFPFRRRQRIADNGHTPRQA